MRINYYKKIQIFSICFLLILLSSCKPLDKSNLYIVGQEGTYQLATRDGLPLKTNKKIIGARDNCYTEPRVVKFSDNSWGFVSAKGIVIAEGFEDASCFTDGLARVEKDRRVSYINIRGESEIDASTWKIKKNSLGIFSDELILFSEKRENLNSGTATFTFNQFNSYAGYLDRNGNVKIQPIYIQASHFHDDMAYVIRFGNKKFEYINKSGDTVLPEKYLEAGEFSEGLANVSTHESNGKTGYIDKNGDFVIAPRFEKASPFSEGLAAVKEGGKWGYIDKRGTYIIAPKFSEAGRFHGGLAHVKAGIRMYVDQAGKVVFKDSDVSPIAPSTVSVTSAITPVTTVHNHTNYLIVSYSGKNVENARVQNILNDRDELEKSLYASSTFKDGIVNLLFVDKYPICGPNGRIYIIGPIEEKFVLNCWEIIGEKIHIYSWEPGGDIGTASMSELQIAPHFRNNPIPN